MNKHQIIAYIKYGKLISEINDKIINQTVRSDMIKFLIKFPGNLIYPYEIYQPVSISKNYGKFIFKITKSSKFIFLNFDGNNNFEICTYRINNLPINNITWASIDDIKYYVDTHLDDFNNIIE